MRDGGVRGKGGVGSRYGAWVSVPFPGRWGKVEWRYAWDGVWTVERDERSEV